MTELLSPREVARRYGAPRDFVYASLQSGRLKGIRRGNRWLVATFAVEDWLQMETGDHARDHHSAGGAAVLAAQGREDRDGCR